MPLADSQSIVVPFFALFLSLSISFSRAPSLSHCIALFPFRLVSFAVVRRVSDELFADWRARVK